MTSRVNDPGVSDPLIDEVRAIRRGIAERFDFDIDRMCEFFAEQEQRHPERMYRPGRAPEQATSTQPR